MEPRITVTGNVGASVNVRVTPRGKTIAEFTMAHTRRVLTDGQWADGPTTWVNVKCLGTLAANVASSLKKGDAVVVTGRMEDDVWHPHENETRTKTWVIADSVGHDLTRGVTKFERTSRSTGGGAAEPGPSEGGPEPVEVEEWRRAG